MQAVAASLDFTKENLAGICAVGSDGEKAGQIIIPVGMHSSGFYSENFTAIPSTLIAGTTGSGKSAFVKTVLVEMMQKYSPNQVRFAVYDSRRIDYSFLNSNPFLLVPLCHEPSKAMGLINWALAEAHRRMNGAGTDEEYPHLVIVLDDFSEMDPSSSTFADLIQLFQIARRTRIHIWLVTSTPSSNVLPTDLKANINHKVSFRVSSKSISRIVLDDAGAETLDVPGEMITKLNNEIVKCESVFLDDSAIEMLSKAAIEKNPLRPTEALNRIPSNAKAREMDPFLGEDGKDELFEQAVEVVFETKQASVSMIQRRLKLGYSRAARIVDQMEEIGIVGPFEGSKPRQILVTKEQWQAQRSNSVASPVTRVDETKINSAQPYPLPPKERIPLLTQQVLTLGTGYSIRTSGDCVVVHNSSGETSIPGMSITELVCKKPGILRKGSLNIVFVANLPAADQSMTNKRTVDIPFESKDSGKVKAFCKQISMDVKKPIVEL